MLLSVSGAESLEALHAEWDALEVRSHPRLPFARPWWTRSWLRHFAQHSVMLRDHPWPLTVRDQAGVLRGLVPLVRTERPSVGPLRARLVRPVGSDPNVTELSGPICAPADAAAVVEAVLAWLEARPGDWDLLVLPGLPPAATGPFERRRGARWGEDVTDFLLELPESWDAFRATLGRNVKESLRKCYNSLKRDGHTFEFRVRATPEEMGPAVEEFLRLHSARAGLTGTIDHLDVFGGAHARAFLREVMGEAARVGEARVFQLVIGGAVVATRLGFQLGDQLYLYFSGFDPAWKQYSVMTTTVAEAIRWAIEQRLTLVNLSPGRDVSKTRWGPHEVVYRQAGLVSRSLRGAAVNRGMATVHRHWPQLRHLLAFARRER